MSKGFAFSELAKVLLALLIIVAIIVFVFVQRDKFLSVFSEFFKAGNDSLREASSVLNGL